MECPLCRASLGNCPSDCSLSKILSAFSRGADCGVQSLCSEFCMQLVSAGWPVGKIRSFLSDVCYTFALYSEFNPSVDPASLSNPLQALDRFTAWFTKKVADLEARGDAEPVFALLARRRAIIRAHYDEFMRLNHARRNACRDFAAYTATYKDGPKSATPCEWYHRAWIPFFFSI